MDLSEIIPERLWVGAVPSKSDLIELKRQYGTELVIMDLVGIADEKAWCQELGITYDERTPKLEENRQAIPLSLLKVASGVIGDNVDSGKKVILHCLRDGSQSYVCCCLSYPVGNVRRRSEEHYCWQTPCLVRRCCGLREYS